MLKLKIHLNFPHRFPSVNPFVPWIHWFTPQLRLDTEISFVPRFNRSIRGGVKGYFQSVQSNRRSLKRWKQVAYSAPWSMKPMQPSCRWFDEFATPFSLSLDPFPSIFAPTIRRIFLFHDPFQSSSFVMIDARFSKITLDFPRCEI